tara:strand:- start:73 stop:324 length:252 start_codon:yes stop_codon:yes gene_type:complete
MKKLLAIVVLGLALTSCSEYSDYNKRKMLEKCADEMFEKEKGIQPVLKLELKGKLLHDFYNIVYGNCEDDLKTHPIRFKEQWK